MRNITNQIKDAMSVDALWSISDFYYFLETIDKNGFKTSHWKGEENWANLNSNNIEIGYIWQKYPLIFIKEDYADKLKMYADELKYIVVIISKDLTSPEFIIDMDEYLHSRIHAAGLNTKSFSANDLWFHSVTV